jgi:hypothetical protein
MRIRSFIQSFLWLALLLVVTSNVALAQIPREISYQGIVIDGSGNPIRDGLHTLEVSFYDQPFGGTVLHGETFSTDFKTGIFNVILGSQIPFPNSLQFDKRYYLGVSVDGGVEMAPRTPLTAAPYAIRAGSADVAKSVSTDARGVVTSLNELDGPVRIVGDTTIRVSQNGQVISLSAIIPDIKGVPFNLITSGVNTGQTLVVGDSTKLYPQGKGEITANRLTGASFTVNSNADSYAGRVKIPKGVSSLTINVNPSVGCSAGSSVTVSQFDTEGSEILVGTMVTRIINNSFTVQFSAAYPSDTGQITYLIVNP